MDVVVTGLPSDAHTWNLVFIQLLIEDLGHHVINLGPCVPQDEIVESCGKYQPDLLVVSSVNGHGFQDAEQLIRAIRSRWELAGLPAVIGGKLGVLGAEGRAGHGRRLLEAGFDAVFQEGRGEAEAEDENPNQGEGGNRGQGQGRGQGRGQDQGQDLGLGAFEAFVARLAAERVPAATAAPLEGAAR
ncbi:cobalamin B12-binding domain-containing protein [Streptomyces sp. NBC_00572]|uniref:cobalamin B12-binding domain-containing protein n=1 Tax=Streptomyces sp. NBC_00572 TaxID=2903664 RepID=UPI00224CF829|nr:cobalamin-dependent protein [Streptomyces sp. NBC_00572]MCX4983993.1 cobalamin-dependent protein [Streptomyces sp. NBC_00572]